MLPVQGRLLDQSDRPVSGPTSMTFAIYAVPDDQANANPTPALWTATYDVQVYDGVYAVNLGELPRPTFPANLFEGTAERYLGVSVAGGAEMRPRLRLGSVPHAFVASRAFQADDAQKLGGELPATYHDAALLTGTVPADALANAVLQVQGSGVVAAERAGTSVMLSMAKATATADGYLAAADFARFDTAIAANASAIGALGQNTYSKSDVDAALALKANASALTSLDQATYKKTEVDQKLAAKADTTALANYLPLSGGTITGNLGVSGALTAGSLAGSVGAATVPFDLYNPETHQLETKTLSVTEALCQTRHGIWTGGHCTSPLVYGTTTIARTGTDTDAIATCPTGYTPADCQTAFSLLQTWRLNPNREAPNGHAWCAGTVDGTLNSDAGKRAMPGFWYAAGSAAPMVCNTGSAIVVDQCAPGENGCTGRASYPRPHMYCQPETQLTKWLCVSTSLP